MRIPHSGLRFGAYRGREKSPFERLFELFKELLLHTSGEVEEALDWLRVLDKEHNLTTSEYTVDDFVEDLKKRGYLREVVEGGGGLEMSAKTEQALRQSALEKVFGKLKKTGNAGNHRTRYTGSGDEDTAELRAYEYGDAPDTISMTESLQNAQILRGPDPEWMLESDLLVRERLHKSQLSTVLMIDLSHSMILYGEDRITPAKRVALALAELIRTRYPKDSLDIIAFGNDAWPIELSELPYLQVGPYHTNTVAGLELAMDLLRRRKTKNKQIFMITDGKPTCLKEGIRYYKNSFGLDRKIVSKTLTLAAQCRRLDVPITTFMIATDPYLKEFVQEFTRVNNGRAYYSNLQGLGGFVLEDFQRNRRKNLK